jgi:outer membrane protein insertion porin family
MRLILLAITLCSAIFGAAPIAWAADGTPLREIRVIGAERIEPTTVAAYMDLRKGDPLTDETIDRALKSLFATGMFADVAMTQRGDMLEVKIKENPIVNEVAFEGNDRLSDESLMAEIQMRPRQIYSRARVQSDVGRIYQIYQRSGRFATLVEPKIIELDQNRVNLVFEINESAVTKVESIRFVGNERFSDNTLRDVIATRESRWYNFLTTNDRYDQDRLAFDQEQLRKFYLNNGYADFQVISAQAEMSPDQESFFITFTVDEGPRYKVGQVGVQSFVRDFNAETLNDYVGFSAGDWYSAEAVETAVDDMTTAMGNLQYAFVSVRPSVQRNMDQQTIDVAFQVNETPRVFVERIDIHGNVRTQDKVVRREMELIEGDPLNRAILAKSEKNIREIGFFEKVNVQTLPGSAPDKAVIDVEVAEQSTGEVSIGAGFSSTDGPLADLRLSERNFLGKGQDVSFATTIAGERTEFDVSFTEPYFLNRDISAGFDAFHMTRDLQDESSYDQKRTGGALRMGYPISEHWRQLLKYRYENNDISNVEADASTFIRNQEGQRTTSAVSQRLTYDNRDSTLFPTDGWMLWLDTEYAGLGGDASYVSGKTGASFYYPVTKTTTLNLLAETGAIEGLNDDIEINERYFVGGTNLRGFERSGIGPRDRATRDALGGNYFYRGTAELSFPIGLPKEYGVQGHGFTDVGSLWGIDETGSGIDDESSIRGAAGVGVSWRSPLGPIRMDYAIPYASEDFDKEQEFRFNFGTRF